MHDSRQNHRWQAKAFGALLIALLCTAAGLLIPEQGYSTFKVFGADFGLARIKSLTFIIWSGERFRFPLDWCLFLLALVSVGVAIVVTRNHFKQRSACA